MACDASAAGIDRLYAAGFNGSFVPPWHGNHVSAENFSGNSSLFVIDPADGRLISSMPMREAGYFLAVSPDGARLYSTNGYSKNVTVIDLDNLSLAAFNSLDSPACGIAISPDGRKIYVALPEERAIAVLDAGNCSTEALIPLNVSPYSLAVSSDGTLLFAASMSDGTVSAIGLPGNRPLSTIPVGPGLSDLVFILNHTVIVAGGDDRIYVIDAPAIAIKAAVRGVNDPSYIAFDVAKNALLVTSLTDRNITKIDASGYNITLTRDFWSDYYGRPAVSRDGSRIYVPDEWGTIRVINASSLVDTGGFTVAYPVTALIYTPLQAAFTGPTPSPVPAAPKPDPGAPGLTGPTFYPVYGTSTPSPTPEPAAPAATPARGWQHGFLPYREWEPPIPVEPITHGDIIFVLVGVCVVLVLLSGITYMMMFRGKKE
ncbi:MAG: hypothetical protein A4E28_01585 [Methanocella sp. PtaU1.Bin125]|nr:MAG: hypothetical protein A4E28_01585 [Methanocella sp. PtaU1.Bin125]